MKSIKFLILGSMTMGLISLAVVGDALFAMQTAGDDFSTGSDSSSHRGSLPAMSFVLPDIRSRADSGEDDPEGYFAQEESDASDILVAMNEACKQELNGLVAQQAIAADPIKVEEITNKIKEINEMRRVAAILYDERMKAIAEERAEYFAELEEASQSSPMKREDFVSRNAKYGVPRGMEDLYKDEEEVAVPLVAPNPAAARGFFFDDSDDDQPACV